MRVVKSTGRHKLHYQFAQFVEFPYHTKGISEWRRWCDHFENKYGPSWSYRIIEEQGISVPVLNGLWREEHDRKQKRLRVYINQAKDLTWAQLALS